jgi:hypothetical protein
MGGRLSEIGPYYDSNNDPVTNIFACEFTNSAASLLQRRAVGAIMSATA